MWRFYEIIFQMLTKPFLFIEFRYEFARSMRQLANTQSHNERWNRSIDSKSIDATTKDYTTSDNWTTTFDVYK